MDGSELERPDDLRPRCPGESRGFRVSTINTPVCRCVFFASNFCMPNFCEASMKMTFIFIHPPAYKSLAYSQTFARNTKQKFYHYRYKSLTHACIRSNKSFTLKMYIRYLYKSFAIHIYISIQKFCNTHIHIHTKVLPL